MADKKAIPQISDTQLDLLFEWRKKTFRLFMRGMTFASTFILGLALYHLIYFYSLGYFSLPHTISVVIFYLVSYFYLLRLTFSPHLNFSFRVISVLGILLVLGIFLLKAGGLNGNALQFFFSVIVLAAVFLDRHQAVFFQLISLGIIAFFAFVLISGIHIIPPELLPNSTSWVSWLGEVLNFILLSSLALFSISNLVQRLELSISSAHQTEARLEMMVQSAPNAIISVDYEQRILMFNKAAEEIFMYSAEEVIGQHLNMLIPERFHHTHHHHVEEFSSGASYPSSILISRELTGRRANGEVFPVEVSVSRVKRDESLVLTVILQDITRRKKTQDALKASERRAQILLKFSKQLETSQTPKEIMQATLDVVEEVMGYKNVWFYIYTQERQNAELVGVAGWKAPLVEKDAQVLFIEDDKFLKEISDGDKPVVVEDARIDPRTNKTAVEHFENISLIHVPAFLMDEHLGVLGTGSFADEGVYLPLPNELDLLSTMASYIALALDRAQSQKRIREMNAELVLAYDSTLEGWARALDLRDKETGDHTLRVAELTVALARAMGIADDELIHIWRGALLHDIGKMSIPDTTLKKAGSLTTEEWETMRQHPQNAYDMLSSIPYLEKALDIPYCHHEKWDGSGYPRGLKGEDIPFKARIFSVVDVWDALRSDRPYRLAWEDEKVVRYIRERAGVEFDPQVVDAFFELVDK